MDMLFDGTKVVILVGAGVSMVAPSVLPSGAELLNGSLRSLITEPHLRPYLDAVTKNSGWGKVVPEAIFQRISDTVGYLPLNGFGGLATAVPNGVHRVLAEVATRPGKTIVTTNFDLLIEKASDQPIRVSHIHGRIDRPDTMFTVIRRIGRGLPSDAKAEFARALETADALLCLGYSGNDTDVMRVVAEHRPGRIVWVARDDARVKENCSRAGLSAVEPLCVDLANLAVVRPPDYGRRPSVVPSEIKERGETALSEGMQAEILMGCLDHVGAYELSVELADAEIGRGVVQYDERLSLSLLAAHAANRMGNSEKALSLCSGFSEENIRTPNLLFRFRTERGLAYLDCDHPRLDLARNDLRAALAVAKTVAETQEPDGRTCLGWAHHNLGYAESVVACEGDVSALSRAIPFYEQAIKEKRACGDLAYLQSSLRNLAAHRVVVDGTPIETDRFPREYGEFCGICEQHGLRWDQSYFWALLAFLLDAAGRGNDARKCAKTAIGLYTGLDHKDEVMIGTLRRLIDKTMGAHARNNR
ncbi:SIR2 family NAD-dependent protein deacylase [Bifidobacterium rousetti]|uniref:SIR2 family NAD-dependent protein deacylase n=1 Tax=Bifidobacterium rousetti TaxID=2045439 RepID=UPI001239AC72|nr:hypothetical protein [Bifidobacterium rousetti]